jgi:hypothetical protein
MFAGFRSSTHTHNDSSTSFPSLFTYHIIEKQESKQGIQYVRMNKGAIGRERERETEREKCCYAEFG